MRTVRQFGVILVAGLLLGALEAPPARAGVNCSDFPSWCPPGISMHNNAQQGADHSTPAPGALGLLALGAAVGIARMRHRKKKD